MENNLVTLKMYEDYFKAVNDKQFLIANRIDCYLANQYTKQNYWLIKQAVGGIKLQVFEKDKELALEFFLRNQR